MQAEDSPYTDSGRGVGDDTPANSWWRAVLTLSGSKIPRNTRDSVKELAGGRRCLLTQEEQPINSIQVCHLVARSAETHLVRTLQYSFGRRFSPDNRWNVFRLKADFHISFDDSEWALVPELEFLREIVKKIREELEKRSAPGSVQSPWPDFRSEEWFPIERGKPFNYIFVPLMLRLNDVPIHRREWESGPGVRTPYLPPEYHGFPVISSHVHPYMVIANAAPKLKKHAKLFDQNHPAELRESIQFIYDIWMANAGHVGPQPRSTSGRGSPRAPPTHSSASRREGLRSRQSGRINGQTNGNPAAGNSSGNLGGQGAIGHQVDSCGGDFFGLPGESGGMDQDFDASTGTSRSPLSISAPDESVTTPEHLIRASDSSPRCDNHSPKLGGTSTHADPTVCMPKDLYDWVDGANVAREDNKLYVVHNLPEQLERYAAEPARRPYKGDWHEWTSEFVPRNIPADGSVLSSNDWVVVSNLLPLTRAL